MDRLTLVAHILPVVIDGSLPQQQKPWLPWADVGKHGVGTLLGSWMLRQPTESTLWSSTPSKRHGSYFVLDTVAWNPSNMPKTWIRPQWLQGRQEFLLRLMVGRSKQAIEDLGKPNGLVFAFLRVNHTQEWMYRWIKEIMGAYGNWGETGREEEVDTLQTIRN